MHALFFSMTTTLLRMVVQYLTIYHWSCFLPFAKIDFPSTALTWADFSLFFPNQRVSMQLEMGKMGPLAIQPFEIHLFFLLPQAFVGGIVSHCESFPLAVMPGQNEEKELIACCSCLLVPNQNAVRNFYFIP